MLKIPRIVSRFLLAAAILAPLSSSAVEPVRVVATGGRIGNTFYPHPTGSTSFRQRTPHKLGGPVAEMQVGFMDWMYTDKTETTNETNDVTITHAWLERASTGQIVPLTFAGGRQLVMPKNSTTPYWLSDAIPSSAWTGAAPAQDEVFWLQVKGTIPAEGKTPVGTPATFSGSKFIAYPPANDPGTQDIGGALPAITGSTSRTLGMPLIFLGRFTGPGHLAVIGIGDSIMDGTGDLTNPVPAISGYGFFNRAALDATGANTIAMFNLTRHGQTASAWMSPGKQSRQVHFLPFANVIAEEYGTNDIGGGGTGNTTNLLTNLDGIWTAARNAGVQKIVRTLLMPRTTSTAQWNTLADQTPNAGWGAGEKRDILNAGLVAAKNAGKIDVLLDTLAVMGDPTDNTRWLTNGANKYLTSDGTHISPTGNARLAPYLRAALLSLSVDDTYTIWSKSIDWNGADSTPGADPNQDGVTNLLAYALGLSPLDAIAPGALPSAKFDTTTANGPWLTFDYRENSRAKDVTFTVQTSPDLETWTNATPDGTTIIAETASADADGNGRVSIRRLRLKPSADETRRFVRLRTSL